MSDEPRSVVTFKLPKDQMRRLEKLADRKKQSKQAFIEGAVYAEMTAEEQRRGSVPHDAPKAPPPSFNVLPTPRSNDEELSSAGGFATLGDQLNRIPRPTRGFYAREETPPTATQPQIVINNTTGGGSSSEPLKFLVDFVVSGETEFEQQNNLRMVATILQKVSSSDEERKALAAKVDELVAARNKSKPANEGGVMRTAKLVFDKMQDLLK